MKNVTDSNLIFFILPVLKVNGYLLTMYILNKMFATSHINFLLAISNLNFAKCA